jgi:hypothetical protein
VIVTYFTLPLFIFPAVFHLCSSSLFSGRDPFCAASAVYFPSYLGRFLNRFQASACQVNEIYALLRNYATYNGNYLPTLRDNLPFPFSRVNS